MFLKTALAVIILLKLCACNNAINCKFKSLQCEVFNKSQLVQRECRIKAVGRSDNFVNFRFHLFEKVTHVIVSIRLFKRANGWRPFLYNITVDGCKFMQNPKASPLADYFYSFIKDISNVNHTCPYENDLILKEFRINNDLIRLPYPMGEYGLDTIWTFNRYLTMRVNLSCVMIGAV